MMQTPLRQGSRIVLAGLTLTLGACGGGGSDAVCGDGEVEGEELCDDGNTAPGDGCDDACVGEPAAFRIDDLILRDPHTVAFGSLDATDTVNDLINDSLTKDAATPADGILDLNLVLDFSQVNTGPTATADVRVEFPNCSAPIETTACTPSAEQGVATVARNSADICLDTFDGTTSGYDPAPAPTAAPCFVSDPVDVVIPLGGILVPLSGAEFAATYSGGFPGELTGGLVRGFLTESDAEITIIDAAVPVVGGMPVSALLIDEDKDTNDAGESGWWFYLNYSATPVELTQ